MAVTDYMLTDQYFGWFGFPVNYFPLEATSANVDYTLACDAGSYTITGTNADITSSRTLICEPASGGAYPDIIVSGAGTTDANGTYVYVAKWGGKPLYTNGDNGISWDDNKWVIINAYESGNRYESTDDVATPDLVTTWTVGGDGTLPVPTVAAGTSLGYILTGSGVILTSKHKNLANANIVVSGAGVDAVNGGYVEAGVNKGRHYYTYENYQILWDGSLWLIFYPSQSIYLYGSLDNVATPDLCTTWFARSGVRLPLPAVTVGVKGDGTIHSEMECEAGAHSLTGTNADLTVQRNYTLACEAGAYTLTGSDATLDPTFHYSLACEPGSYTLTGTDISFGNTKSYELVCGAGSYALTGSSASFEVKHNFTIACNAGSYTLTGTNATLHAQFHYSLACNSGSYLLTGTPTSLTSARSIACNSGAYTLTGLEADLFKGLVMPCGNGSYVLAGTPATINSARTFALGMGSYVLVGMNAGLYILTITPDCRTYFIDAENRTLLIGSEDRTMEVRCH